MKGKRIGIKWKIFLYLIGFSALLLGILWLFQVVFLEDFYKRIKMDEVDKAARNIVESIEEGDWDYVNEAVSGRGDLTVEIWNPISKTIYDTKMSREGMNTSLFEEDKRRLLEKLKKDSTPIIQRYTEKTPPLFEKGKMMPRESIIFAARITIGMDKDNLLLVKANISPVNSTVETLRIQFLYISGFMIILSTLLAFFMAKRVAKPITNLNKTAMDLGNGNYDITFRGGGYKEIMELADTLNHAAVELGKTEKLKKELIANISHDLRTPLTLITGYSEMIKDLPDENTEENMQVIIEESKRLTNLVNDMLDLSKIQSGTIPMEKEVFDLTETVLIIKERIHKFCEKNPVPYNIQFSYDQEAEVYGDSVQIAQVLYNLLLNAINYTGIDRKVLIEQVIAENRVKISIKDTGSGIPEDELPYVWDRYYTGKKKNSLLKIRGKGLGLSIAKSILDQHENILYGVESEVGKGSMFWFEMPIHEGENKSRKKNRILR